MRKRGKEIKVGKGSRIKQRKQRKDRQTNGRGQEGSRRVADLHVITQRLQRVIYQSNQRHYRHSAKAGEYVSGPLAVIRSNHE